ncbi:MAG: DUF3343 domain-containing protein [Deltaproteobacteria bacterium]|jgi:bacterioferritin-associated ferredoxin|nr:DUF3343 domain-containing protein [Deltaproteobacteria bacterium]
METVLTFQSAAQALNGEQALAAAGFKVGLMARPTALGSECGFCLRLAAADLARALATLQAAGLAWEGVFVNEAQAGQKARYRPFDGHAAPQEGQDA